VLNAARLRKLLPAGVVGAMLGASLLVIPNLPGTFASCANAGLSANPSSPHAPGGIIVLTASAGCGGYAGGTGYSYNASHPQFRFWELDPGSRWSMVRDYSTIPTFSWNTANLKDGSYNLEVDVKSLDEDSTIAYDTVAHLIYTLGPTCTAATLGTAPASGSGHTGGSVTMTGGSSSCSNPLFKFWIKDAGSTSWSIVQNYSSTTTHIWGPVGTYHVGQYSMEVDVRDSASSATYDTVHNITYNLVGCTAATITPVPNGGIHGAVDVTLTATATCPGTATYRFWMLDAGGTRWSMVKDYSTSNTYTWVKANQKAGVTKIEVDVRDLGSADVYEFATQGQTDTLT